MIIKIKVKTSSGKHEIVKIGEDEYNVYLKSPPENNKANLELIGLIAKYFNTNHCNIRIKRGLKSRDKILEIL